MDRLEFEFKTLRFNSYEVPDVQLNQAGDEGWDVASTAYDNGNTLNVILRRAKIVDLATGQTVPT